MPDALYDFLLECWDKVRDFCVAPPPSFYGAQPGLSFVAFPPLCFYRIL